jgi:rieske iron-sulfur protein
MSDACGRRSVLKLVLAMGVALPRMATAQEPRARRPQKNDRVVFAGGERKGELIAPSDVAAGGQPVTAYPLDPATKTIRDDSRLNEILLIRLDPAALNADTRARAAEGIVAYSAICTHTGCDAWEWQPAASTIKCSCHFSEFALNDGARVVSGPAPRRLPSLPLAIVDGALVVADAFVGRPGFESSG